MHLCIVVVEEENLVGQTILEVIYSTRFTRSKTTEGQPVVLLVNLEKDGLSGLLTNRKRLKKVFGDYLHGFSHEHHISLGSLAHQL